MHFRCKQSSSPVNKQKLILLTNKHLNHDTIYVGINKLKIHEPNTEKKTCFG